MNDQTKLYLVLGVLWACTAVLSWASGADFVAGGAAALSLVFFARVWWNH